VGRWAAEGPRESMRSVRSKSSISD
jgi:hypothetical protein